MFIAFVTIVQSLIWSLNLYGPCDYLSMEEHLMESDFYPDPGYKIKVVIVMSIFGISICAFGVCAALALLFHVCAMGLRGHMLELLGAVAADAIFAFACVGIPMAVTVAADLPSMYNATQFFPAGDKCAVIYIRDGWHESGVLIVLQAFLLPVLCALLVLLPYAVAWLVRRCSGERMRQVWLRAIKRLNVKLGPTEAAAADDAPDYVNCSAI